MLRSQTWSLALRGLQSPLVQSPQPRDQGRVCLLPVSLSVCFIVCIIALVSEALWPLTPKAWVPVLSASALCVTRADPLLPFPPEPWAVWLPCGCLLPSRYLGAKFCSSSTSNRTRADAQGPPSPPQTLTPEAELGLSTLWGKDLDVPTTLLGCELLTLQHPPLHQLTSGRSWVGLHVIAHNLHVHAQPYSGHYGKP